MAPRVVIQIEPNRIRWSIFKRPQIRPREVWRPVMETITLQRPSTNYLLLLVRIMWPYLTNQVVDWTVMWLHRNIILPLILPPLLCHLYQVRQVRIQRPEVPLTNQWTELHYNQHKTYFHFVHAYAKSILTQKSVYLAIPLPFPLLRYSRNRR